MEHLCIECPETKKREEVDFERTPCGVVIDACGRFASRHAVTCSRRCARQLDHSKGHGIDDAGPRVLVLHGGGNHRTKAIAHVLAGHLACDQLAVDVADVDFLSAPPPDDYDAVVVGSCVRRGRHPRSVIEYVGHHGVALAAMPAFLFSVGNDDDIGRMHRTTGWLPQASAVFEIPEDDKGLQRRLISWLWPELVAAADTRFAYSSRIHDFALKIAEKMSPPELAVTWGPARSRLESE